MAKHGVTYSCGHEGTITLFGPYRERERKLNWYHDSALCPDCYRAKIEKERIEASQAAAVANAGQGLPALSGSPKQIAWAETIRAEAIKALDEFISKLKSRLEQATAANHPEAEKASNLMEVAYKHVASIKAHIEAHWWIEHRQAGCLWISDLQDIMRTAAAK